MFYSDLRTLEQKCFVNYRKNFKARVSLGIRFNNMPFPMVAITAIFVSFKKNEERGDASNSKISLHLWNIILS